MHHPRHLPNRVRRPITRQQDRRVQRRRDQKPALGVHQAHRSLLGGHRGSLTPRGRFPVGPNRVPRNRIGNPLDERAQIVAAAGGRQPALRPRGGLRRPGAAQGFRGLRRPRRHQAVSHTRIQCAKRGVPQRVARRRVAVVAAGGSAGHHPQLTGPVAAQRLLGFAAAAALLRPQFLGVARQRLKTLRRLTGQVAGDTVEELLRRVTGFR